MLDIKFIRENAELVRAAAKKKRVEFDLDKLLAADGRRLQLLKTVETERARQNEMGEKIVSAPAEEKSKLIAEMALVKGEFKKNEEAMAAVMKEWRQLMLGVPNIPDISVPDGQDESGNAELAVWGKKPKFDFEPKDHLALMTALGMVDFERGGKDHGLRGYFLIGRGTELAWALFNYTREFFA